jgi:hypothetical protein
MIFLEKKYEKKLKNNPNLQEKINEINSWIKELKKSYKNNNVNEQAKKIFKNLKNNIDSIRKALN